MKEKKERFLKAFNYLRGEGIINTQLDLADKMSANNVNIGYALKGNKSYLTDKFLKRFNETFEGIFDINWLLKGDGDMFSGSEVSISSPKDSVPYEFVQALFEERKRADEQRIELIKQKGEIISQNGKLIDILHADREKMPIKVVEDAGCADAKASSGE